MNIAKKIEEIQQQPEHIRLRWVWGSVAVSMLIILIIWLLSITLMFKSNRNESSQESSNSNTDAQNQTISNTPSQSNSLKDYTKNNSISIESEGIAPSKEVNPNQVGGSTNSTSNSSNSYKNLPK